MKDIKLKDTTMYRLVSHINNAWEGGDFYTRGMMFIPLVAFFVSAFQSV